MESKEIKEDLNIERNIRKLIINRLKNPKFATNVEVCESLGLSERHLYFMADDLRIDLSSLQEYRLGLRAMMSYNN